MADIWADPVGYNPLTDAPPYLPGRTLPRRASVAFPVEERRKVQASVAKLAARPEVEARMILDHLLGQPALRGNRYGELAVLLAALRAVSQVHQSHHWRTCGPTYFADHELFSRLYNESVALVDGLAERGVGLGAAGLVDPVFQAQAVSMFVRSYVGVGSETTHAALFPTISFRAVIRVLVLFRLVYERLGNNQQRTPGLDNLLQGVADVHEQHAYLLRQRCQPG